MYKRSPGGLDSLRLLGDQLDAGRAVRVLTGGFVTLDRDHSADDISSQEEEGGEHARGSEAREGRGAAGKSAGAKGPQGRIASVLGQVDMPPRARSDIRGAEAEYEQLRAHFAPPNLWLGGWLRPISNLPDTAFLLIRYPIDQLCPQPTAWAWWRVGIRVGPRHTNTGPELGGSICAADDADGTWRPGDALLDLVDLYSVWLARHLYLAIFRRWPGPQRLHTPYERLTEHAQNELCGCGSLTIYERCCLKKDLTEPDEALVPAFLKHFPQPYRTIPIEATGARQHFWPWQGSGRRPSPLNRFIAAANPKARWSL